MDNSISSGISSGYEKRMAQWFTSKSYVPKTCTQEFLLGVKLGEGRYSSVYEACRHGKDCRYVSKVLPLALSRGPDPRDVTVTTKEFEQEVKVTRFMGRNGVGPLVRSAWICEWRDVGGPYDLGFIVMDKSYITLWNYLQAQKLIGTKPQLAQIRFLLWKKSEKMLSLGIVHTDLHANNVMLNMEPNGDIQELFIIDWGRVAAVPKYSGDQLVLMTTNFVNGIWNKLISGR